MEESTCFCEGVDNAEGMFPFVCKASVRHNAPCTRPVHKGISGGWKFLHCTECLGEDGAGAPTMTLDTESLGCRSPPWEQNTQQSAITTSPPYRSSPSQPASQCVHMENVATHEQLDYFRSGAWEAQLTHVYDTFVEAQNRGVDIAGMVMLSGDKLEVYIHVSEWELAKAFSRKYEGFQLFDQEAQKHLKEYAVSLGSRARMGPLANKSYSLNQCSMIISPAHTVTKQQIWHIDMAESSWQFIAPLLDNCTPTLIADVPTPTVEQAMRLLDVEDEKEQATLINNPNFYAFRALATPVSMLKAFATPLMGKETMGVGELFGMPGGIVHAGPKHDGSRWRAVMFFAATSMSTGIGYDYDEQWNAVYWLLENRLHAAAVKAHYEYTLSGFDPSESIKNVLPAHNHALTTFTKKMKTSHESMHVLLAKAAAELTKATRPKPNPVETD